MKLFIVASGMAVLLTGCSISPFSQISSFLWGAAVMIVIVIVTLVVIGCQLDKGKGGYSPACDERFSEANITETFVSSIPTLTQEMNLEVASSKQTEIFERSDTRKLFGINLGTNVAQLKVPTTYRFHIHLYDQWRLDIADHTLVVYAPAIRCSVPPAIHTDEIQTTTQRGWARCFPVDMLEQLHHELTPKLTELANDPRRIELVRETCRRSVGDFMKGWLERENRWKPGKFMAVRVHFVNEPAVQTRPTVRLPGNKRLAA